MSHKPIATLSGFSLLGGIFAYTKFGSTPSLVGSFGIGSLMLLSSMRIRDGMDYGYEGAVASSVALVIPTLRRTIKTRLPVPATVCALATASTAYYISALSEFKKHAI
ncbi:hypothetical protein I302_102362 [Kwoniella bestiolae CBS 10118]|uniref:Transmembrane protein 14 n=1 Tax=Kwoniella bestiolae CBS 10118 TaxID=1296100 RepID=A0A1B9GEY3_9TREE|nr:hypothetical protein I302_01054 [Kwoniella bestiolae CBS 10118]OCF29546.1 hypothetical protein I302_01054 [Kwoniella bestiolae CBS 10118]